MPTYEYKREDGTTFEVLQSMNDKPLTTCPTTGQPVRRMISGGSGVVYKGDGFYITDYKNKNGGAKEESKTTSKSTSDSAKTETAKGASES
ncbi:MAG: FmdB family transcriptional regulator [Bacteroidetes bacterium]|jgi:putative FmdB family regulatory protein|nr:MAG: FmdB family transcriptional regulator [Bacteroidota bacterium]